MKAVVLAAGLGSRLKPITDYLPKPLVPILNQPLLQVVLGQLSRHGFGPFAINSYHLPEVIASRLETPSLKPFNVHVSVESPVLLGTGGALNPLREWLNGESFLVCNGDIVSNIDFRELARAHSQSGCLVTMAVTPGHTGTDRVVWVDESCAPGRVVSISKNEPNTPQAGGPRLRPYSFACAYIAQNELLQFISSQGESDLTESINKAISLGHVVEVMVHTGFWADIGTPKGLWDASLNLAHMPEEALANIFGEAVAFRRDSECTYLEGAKVFRGLALKFHGLVIIGDHCSVGDQCSLTDCLILPGSTLPAGSMISGKIVGPHSIDITI